MKKIKLQIDGMHCSSCASNVERSLKKIPQVKSVSVSVITKKAFIEAEESIKNEDIKAAVAKTGYKLVSMEG